MRRTPFHLELREPSVFIKHGLCQWILSDDFREKVLWLQGKAIRRSGGRVVSGDRCSNAAFVSSPFGQAVRRTMLHQTASPWVGGVGQRIGLVAKVENNLLEPVDGRRSYGSKSINVEILRSLAGIGSQSNDSARFIDAVVLIGDSNLEHVHTRWGL